MSLNGRWRGWYTYGTGGQHHPMELLLTQRGQSVSGAVHLLKRYLTHAVDYDGHSDGKFIRGAWRLLGGSGAFCLWRDGSEPALAEAKPEPKFQSKPRPRAVS